METITLRDYFAAQFLSGISISLAHTSEIVEERAKLAYIYADTLLWARGLEFSQLGSANDINVNPPGGWQSNRQRKS